MHLLLLYFHWGLVHASPGLCSEGRMESRDNQAEQAETRNSYFLTIKPKQMKLSTVYGLLALCFLILSITVPVWAISFPWSFIKFLDQFAGNKDLMLAGGVGLTLLLAAIFTILHTKQYSDEVRHKPWGDDALKRRKITWLVIGTLMFTGCAPIQELCIQPNGLYLCTEIFKVNVGPIPSEEIPCVVAFEHDDIWIKMTNAPCDRYVVGRYYVLNLNDLQYTKPTVIAPYDYYMQNE
jgi:hypothetical protein